MVISPILFALALSVQAQSSSSLVGTVSAPDGSALNGVNVFLLETLDGSVTDATGRFAIRTMHRGPATLVARRIGFTQLLRAISLPSSDSIRFTLQLAAHQLDAVRVSASTYVTGNEPDVALTALQVVSTPGTAADVFRAIQTFPGVQAVDEGAGLFVRGGDVSETRIFVNGATVLSPYRYESPTGGFFGTFDPFLLDGIYFSSGGFGARYGDALSGVVALNTLGRPTTRAFGATLGLANLSGSLALPFGERFGARATATRSNTELMFRLNGATSDFSQVPEGRDFSGSLHLTYRPDAAVKVFAIDQWNQLGVVVDRPSFSGSFDAEESHDLVVASWTDRFGRVSPVASISRASTDRSQSFGAFVLDTRQSLTQANMRAALELDGSWVVTAGGEVEDRADDISGSVPTAMHDDRPGARQTVFSSRVAGARYALFAESDFAISGRVRFITGLRSDESTLSRRRSYDPRVAAAVKLTDDATLTAAWGVYHQVPAPMHYEATLGDAALGPMRARQLVAGLDWRREPVMLRVEAYGKRYADLAQTTRESETRGEGTGRSRGVDAFVRWNGGLPVSGRVAYSYVSATRTDPNTGLLARSPFDISHGLTMVVERGFGPAHFSAAWRYATGKPLTPVESASPDTVPGVWVPAWGAPMSESLPAFMRLDFSGSWKHSFRPGNLTVFFVGLSNALDRENLYDYLYSADYTTRIPVRSQFNRSVYFGATFQF